MQDQKTVENPYASKKSAYYALVLLTIVYSFNFIDRQLLAILQESVKADLDLSDSQLGLLTGFAFAASGVGEFGESTFIMESNFDGDAKVLAQALCQ